MKPFSLLSLLMLGLAIMSSCQSNSKNNQENLQKLYDALGPTGKKIVQNVPDKIYTGLKAGEIAPDAVKIDVDRIDAIINGTIIVKKGELQALMDLKGNFIVPWGKYSYTAVTPYNTNFNSVNGNFSTLIPATDEKTHFNGYINVKGEEVIGFIDQTDVKPFSALGIADEGGYTYIDETGKKTTLSGMFIGESNKLSGRNRFRQPQYMDIFPVSKSYQVVSGSGYTSERAIIFVDKRGKQVFNAQYIAAGVFTEGLAPVESNDGFGNAKWGFINTKGEPVIPIQFTLRPGHFHNGLALVEPRWNSGVDFNYAYIDKKGNIKLKIGDGTGTAWRPADGNFIEGYAFWTGNDGIALLDTAGIFHKLSEIITQPDLAVDETGPAFSSYSDQGIFFNASGKERVKNDYGLADFKGNVIYQPVFANLYPDYFSNYAIASILLPPREVVANRPEYTTGIVNKQGVFVLLVATKPSF